MSKTMDLMSKELTVMSTDLTATGKNLNRLFKLYGVKVHWLAEQFEISEQAIYNWLRGEKLPSPEYVKAMAVLFNMHMEDLYIAYGEKPREPEDNVPGLPVGLAA